MESRLPPHPLFGAFCSVSSCTVLPSIFRFNAFGLPFARISRRVKAAYPLDVTGVGSGRNARFRRFCLFSARLEQTFPHRKPVERLKSHEGTYSTL